MPNPFFKLAFAALAVCAAVPSMAAPGYPTTQTFGVPFSTDEAWYRQCMRVEHAVAPSAATAQAPGATCDASALYYRKRSQAATSPAEWKTVRECALARGDFAAKAEMELATDSSADTGQLDGALNAVYQKLMSAPSRQKDAPGLIGDSTIDRGEIRKVERPWLAYRDAFTAFRSHLPSGSDRDAITALLLQQRVADLNNITLYL
jgi:uncharacterized protein YecT (DUF1311 family)